MKERKVFIRNFKLAGPYGGSTPADPEPYNPYEGQNRPEYTVAKKGLRLRFASCEGGECESGGGYCEGNGCFLAKQIENQAQHGGLDQGNWDRYVDRVRQEPCNDCDARERAIRESGR